MGGCTNCGGKTGCTDRKSVMLDQVDKELSRLYPTKVWGEMDALQAMYGGIEEAESQEFGSVVGDMLQATATWVGGSEDDYCDFVYVQCVGRPPNFIQIRELGLSALPDASTGASKSGTWEEQYLRICFSKISKLCGVQQVRLNVQSDEDGLVYMQETPRDGVYDAPFLARFRKIVALIGQYGWVHLDFGEISHAPPEYEPNLYPELYGGVTPDITNYLFYPEPSTMARTSLLQLA